MRSLIECFSLALFASATRATPTLPRKVTTTLSVTDALPTVDLEYAIYSGTTTNVREAYICDFLLKLSSYHDQF
jgi:hypothetical protein